MKKIKLVLFTIPFLALVLLLEGCMIQNSKPEECDVKQITVSKIYEGGVKDIVFAETNGDFYYINRGLEQGFTLKGMEDKVLNKKVTLHLAKTIAGTSAHIAQLTLDNEIIFTEFSIPESEATAIHK